jgi:hypothetical protein
MKHIPALFSVLLVAGLVSCHSESSRKPVIAVNGDTIIIRTGVLEQKLVHTQHALTSGLYVHPGTVETVSDEFSFRLSKASPNEAPHGIVHPATGVEQQETVQGNTDALNIEKKTVTTQQQIEWTDAINISSNDYGDVFEFVSGTVERLKHGQDGLVLRWKSKAGALYAGLELTVTYAVYENHPVVRKWISLKNNSDQWIKMEHLNIARIDPVQYPRPVYLTPALRGLDPDIIAFSDDSGSRGVIIASEVPSMVRVFSDDGTTGYRPDFWEWVLGPGESFDAEPVLLYAFSGESLPTSSAVSTALYRCVEQEFKSFLQQYILKPFDISKTVAPLFCTWTNYSADINDRNMRQAADIASEIGFKCFQLDAGWYDAGPSGGWASSSIFPNTQKFPDLKGLSEYIRSKNMQIGLWYSVFRNATTFGVQEPDLFSLPMVKRSGGLGISFAYDKSRKQYAADIVRMNKDYQATYFKQDLSNICYGDIAEGHENRTLKESYLRGLRGLFATQDMIHAVAPDIFLQLSHEIYWETPGPAADIAVLQHIDSYHISPNEYWGAGDRNHPVSPEWKMNRDSLSRKLIEGCFRARTFWYEHRALPLERIEVFGAATTNFNGSLTVDIQDRQICSWLMGAPLSFSGDLPSLTDENIARYRDRFAKVEALQQKHGIYSYFQYSGVPAPTDEDWHWWGKLNEKGCGAVVALRGSGGNDTQQINVPWVNPNRKYSVKFLFSDGQPQVFTGKELQAGKLTLSLKPYGQEIIEIDE